MIDVILNARRRLQLSTDRAYMGKEDGTLRDSGGRYFVRPILSTGNAPAIPLPLRAGLSLTPRMNMVVELGWSKTGQREIVGPNIAAAQAQGINIATLNTGEQSTSLIPKERLGELYCRAHPSKNGYAQVFPGRAFFGNGFIEYAGGEIDLNSFKPSAGNHRYIGVFLKPDGTLTAAGSTAQADSAALDSTDVQEARNAAPAVSLPLRMLRWDGDDTNVDDSSYNANANPNGARDVRNLWGPIPAGGSLSIVRAATTANITLSGAQTIDGVSVVAGDRVLVKSQSTGSQNGIYTAAAGVWARSEDRIQAAMLVSVQEGTVAADTVWTLTTNETIVVGTTSLTFEITYVPKSLYDANTILAATTDNTPAALAMGASTILARLASGNIIAATVAQIKTLLALAFSDITGTLGISAGGTGQTTATAAINALSPTTTKGDLIVDDGTNPVRLAVGTNGYGLAADSAETTGVKWAAKREVLTAARTYYVRTDGSDSNTGLGDSSGGAWLTIQKAVDVCAATLDFAGYTVTIQVRDGTYTGSTLIKAMTGMANPDSLVIQGNNSTPANVLISTTSASCFLCSGPGAWAHIKDLKVQTTTSGQGFHDLVGGVLYLTNINFGACANAHISLSQGAILRMATPMAISGGAQYHILGLTLSTLFARAIVYTLSSTPAFSVAFIALTRACTLDYDANTFNGTGATGKRYDSIGNSVIYTNGAASTYIPGDVAGTTATGGLYI